MEGVFFLYSHRDRFFVCYRSKENGSNGSNRSASPAVFFFLYREGFFRYNDADPMENARIVLNGLFVPSVVAAVAMAVLFVIRGVTFHVFNRWTKRTGAKVNGVIGDSLRTPSIYWCIAIGLYIALELSELPRKYVFVVERTIYILIVFSATIAFANLAVRAFESYAQRSDINIPATGIVFGVFRATIIVAGVLVILNILGVSIAPLLTALGVGGLAVALALKDTLSNLFAGLYIIASKQVRPGDYIKLNSGEEGVVTDITWRSTTIMSSANNIIIVPNAHVASATITNYELPERQMYVSVQVTAPYTGDLGRIEEITCEVARAVMNGLPGAVPGQEPSVRFHTFGDTGVGFSVNVKIEDYSSIFAVRHHLIKALHKRYAEEGIAIPARNVG